MAFGGGGRASSRRAAFGLCHGWPKDIVAVGTHVTVQEEGFDPETYHLVGAKEADPRAGKISHESPIGQALMDHKAGEVVEAETPGGKIKLKILKIE